MSTIESSSSKDIYQCAKDNEDGFFSSLVFVKKDADSGGGGLARMSGISLSILRKSPAFAKKLKANTIFEIPLGKSDKNRMVKKLEFDPDSSFSDLYSIIVHELTHGCEQKERMVLFEKINELNQKIFNSNCPETEVMS